MKMPFLEPVEKPDVKYHSSISQHSNKLYVVKGGEYVPISFDTLDYIDCGKVYSHKSVVTDGDDIGYNYEVGNRRFISDTYVSVDRKGIEKYALPKWFGEGFYSKVVDEQVFTNFDNGSLGNRNIYDLRIGLSYAAADKTLEPTE